MQSVGIFSIQNAVSRNIHFNIWSQSEYSVYNVQPVGISSSKYAVSRNKYEYSVHNIQSVRIFFQYKKFSRKRMPVPAKMVRPD